MAEIEKRYADEITKETRRLEDAIGKAKTKADEKTARKELAAYRAAMDEKKAKESRTRLRELFDYPIFLYDAEKVGITATGEKDQNELYPNDNRPTGLEKTCLELYREFQKNPKAIANGK